MRIGTVRAGIFFLPFHLKRALFSVLSAEVGRQINKRGLTEEDILDDFESWRKSRRETGR